MDPTRATKNDAAGDVNEVGGGNEEAEGVTEFGHGFAREDVAGEKDARENGEKCELHRLCLGGGFTGNQNAERERDEEIGKREKSEKDDATVDGNAEDEDHEGEQHGQFEEADGEIGQ